jgi:hypothetical protein
MGRKGKMAKKKKSVKKKTTNKKTAEVPKPKKQ